jgi:urease accessory protein
MLDLRPADSPTRASMEAATLQRARGVARVALAHDAGPLSATRIAGLRQEGCGKAFLPRVTGDPEVVFLNTSGGLTGGDRLDFSVTLAAGGRATATTQTAERAYAVPPGAAPGEIAVTLSAGDGATLHWLPQETILFEDSALERRTRVDLGRDARLLMCEMLVLGRAAMGETVLRARLHDARTVYRAGRPVLADAVEVGPALLGRPAAPAGLAGARAVALVALVAPGAEAALPGVRAVLADAAGAGLRAGASAWDGRCLVRLAAPDAHPLKLAVARLLRHLGGGALPRVWQV